MVACRTLEVLLDELHRSRFAMRPILIDESGKHWEPRSLALRSRLRASIDDWELAQFAILNLGFIAIAADRDSVRIRLRPAVAAPAALGALYLWLHKRPPRRIVISWYDDRWQDEIVGWGDDGWRRLTALLETTKLPMPGYSRVCASIERLDSANPLRHLLEDRSRLVRSVSNPQLLPAALKGRYVLLTEDGNGELRVSDFGGTMMSRSRWWRRKARGHRIDDMPDWSYGRWVGDAYREARQKGQPLLEDVKAVINWPEVGTFSHSYWRLIVPLMQLGHPTRLLGVTVDKADVGAHKVH
jgi:hypothetical protein